MATKGFQSTAQANPKATLGLGAAAGYLFLGGLKGALLGSGAGALLLGIAGVKKVFSFAGEGEDPRYQGAYDWRAVFGQDDSDASYLDSSPDDSDSTDSDATNSTPEGLDASNWTQDDTTSQGDTSAADDTYTPGAGGMVGTQDQFTSGPELISSAAEDEEGTGVWDNDDDVESEYGESYDDQTDDGGGGYGGGGSGGGGSSGGGSYDAPPPNVPTGGASQGAAGGGPSTVPANIPPPPPDGGLPAAIAVTTPAVATPVDPLAAVKARIAAQIPITQAQQAAAAAAVAAQAPSAGSGRKTNARIQATTPPRAPAIVNPTLRKGPGTINPQVAAMRARAATVSAPNVPRPVGAPTTGRTAYRPPPPPAVVAPVYHPTLGTMGVAGRIR